MIVLEEKSNRKTPNSWLCYAKSLKFSSKKASALTNGNLYHYAGNNPVRYTANGDKNAQTLAEDVTIAAGKEMAAGGLEGVADIAEFSGGVLSDLALETSLIQPEFSAGAGTTSTICSGVEVAARSGKAAITGKQGDIDKAKKSAVKNAGSYAGGKSSAFITKKMPQGVSNFVSGTVSKKFEKEFDKTTKRVFFDRQKS